MSNQWADLSWTGIQAHALTEPIVLLPVACVEAKAPYSPLGPEARLTDQLARESLGKTTRQPVGVGVIS